MEAPTIKYLYASRGESLLWSFFSVAKSKAVSEGVMASDKSQQNALDQHCGEVSSLGKARPAVRFCELVACKIPLDFTWQPAAPKGPLHCLPRSARLQCWGVSGHGFCFRKQGNGLMYKGLSCCVLQHLPFRSLEVVSA